MLHLHHHGEDNLGWPFLRDYMPEAPYATLIDQHAAMVESLDPAEEALKRQDLKGLYDRLSEVNRIWLEHIELEESAFSVDATTEAMPTQAHRKLIRRFQRHAQLHGRPIPMFVAFTLYNLPPEDRAAMAATIPGFVTKILMPTIWQRAWAPMKPFLLSD
jgi:hypothetical protein